MIAERIKYFTEALPQGVKLVAVSKFRPVEELQQAYDAGQRIFAESRPLEFAAKVQALPSDIQWHFIGHLQTNKLKYVLPHAALIHSVDSMHLVEAIEKYALANNLKVNILLEVHVGQEETKDGFTPQELLVTDWSRFCDPSSPVHICGLMGMASHTDNRERIEKDFSLMQSLFAKFKQVYPQMSSFTELSIGMSDDWDIAVRHGATMVRIGSSIFIG